VIGLNTISFLSPALLWALVLLPILWWILRATPPAPLREIFPAVLLLLGLKDRETTPAKTPWWLLALRILALSVAIIGFAEPVLNAKNTNENTRPLMIVMDGSWASASNWTARMGKAREALRRADAAGRLSAIYLLTDSPKAAEALNFISANAQIKRLPALRPQAWAPDFSAWAEYFNGQENGFDTIWFSDGLDATPRANLLKVLQVAGQVTVFEPDTPVMALLPPTIQNGMLHVDVTRSFARQGVDVSAEAYGLDPAGIQRVLASTDVQIPKGDTTATLVFDIPVDLRNRVTRIEIVGGNTAGSVVATGDRVQRRKVALISLKDQQEGSNFVSDLFYLRKALVPSAQVIETDLKTTLQANPDVIIFVDVGQLSQDENRQVKDWVEQGGLLVRFAGRRLAASQIGLRQEHDLLPVRLRAGGRSIGGAMSWGQPKTLQTFDASSPFSGLKIPSDVLVTSQVVAQPDPNLSQRVIAALADGTPLVTQKTLGSGRVVLFHVTANAEWSNLPLSGLFVEMLERLAVSTTGNLSDAKDIEGLIWKPDSITNAFGVVRSVADLPGVDGVDLITHQLSKNLQPGVYRNSDRSIALNILQDGDVLRRYDWPQSVTVTGLQKQQERFLQSYLLIAALMLLLLDAIASLWLSGKLSGAKVGRVATVLIACSLFAPDTGFAQNDDGLVTRINNTVLAYVRTGDIKLDQTSHAGMLGLAAELFRRTSVEPIEPYGVDIETDALSIYPFLYWPISERQKAPSDAAVEKLNRYLRTGGMIMFDTRDAYLSVGGGTANGKILQKIAARLEIPPLEPIPKDHVLTRSFYLLQEFPGRYLGAPVWIEAAPADAQNVEGVPFRNLNDGVSPVIIGGNDWAAAWAIDKTGRYQFPVGRGLIGSEQREFAQRFGVNLVMYVLTGNYKSDQVHIPALLDRLGQ